MDEYINGWSIKQATDQLMLDAPHTYTHMPLGSAHGISDRIHSVRASIRDYFNAPNCPLNRFCHAERKHVQGTCCAAARQEASAEQQRCVAGSLLLSGPTNLTCALVRIRRSSSTDEGGKANLEDVHHGGRFRILFFQPTGTLYGSPGF